MIGDLFFMEEFPLAQQNLVYLCSYYDIQITHTVLFYLYIFLLALVIVCFGFRYIPH